MYSIFVFLLLFFSYSYTGFSSDTVVLSPEALISLSGLQKDSNVTSYDLIKNSIVQGIVTNHHSYISASTYKVICDNDISFLASPNQLVMSYSGWSFVRDLKSGDRLECYKSTYATVLSIEMSNDERRLYEITVEPYHTFYVTSRAILVHNSPAIMITTASLATSIIPAAAKAFGVLGVVGTALYSLFAKNARHKMQKGNVSSSSNCSTPPLPPKDEKERKNREEEEFRKKHPHGRYEDVTYHHKNSSGKKSPRPTNGQEALDNSLSLDINSDMRIGVSNDEFVILNKTSDGLYHGHVRQWKGLTDTMQAVLRKFNKVTKKGKIIS